jgi:hypothetical protein
MFSVFNRPPFWEAGILPLNYSRSWPFPAYQTTFGVPLEFFPREILHTRTRSWNPVSLHKRIQIDGSPRELSWHSVAKKSG